MNIRAHRAQLWKWRRSPRNIVNHTVNNSTAKILPSQHILSHVVLRMVSSYSGRGLEDQGYKGTNIIISVYDFHSHWIKVLKHHEIPDPFWSVKWITEHVQKNDQSDSSIPSDHVSTLFLPFKYVNILKN